LSPVIETPAKNNTKEDDFTDRYLASYKIMVSKLNGWQLNQELAGKLELYDELMDRLAKSKTESQEKRGTTENDKAKVEKEIEILRERMRRRPTNSSHR
jgi:hypothetical protein